MGIRIKKPPSETTQGPCEISAQLEDKSIVGRTMREYSGKRETIATQSIEEFETATLGHPQIRGLTATLGFPK